MSETTLPLILVIDDRQDIVGFCKRHLGADYTFRHVPGGRAAKLVVRSMPVEAVLLDRDFSQADPDQLLGPRDAVRDEGLHVLRWLRQEHPGLPVLMVTGQRDLSTALAVAELGADFLAWEDVLDDPEVLASRLRQVFGNRIENSNVVTAPFRRLGIVAESPAFIRALGALSRALPGRAPILLLGPTGTGKDSLAYAAHALAGDPARPFVGVNVAALNPGLVESELFGHARGAFTTALQASLGKLRAAHGGTLFLNEIGDLTPEVQAKLLTVLERAEVVPVGEVRSYPAEFRLIAATSRDLRHLVETGQFRRDLLHRIAWHTIELPTLGERPEDIPALAHAFLRATGPGGNGQVLGFAREALEYLVSLPWPGNVRELRGVIEATCAHARHMITVGDLREVVRRMERFAPSALPAATPAVSSPPAGCGRPAAHRHELLTAQDEAFADLDFEQVNAAYYFHLMRRAGGQISEVARLAGIAKTTAYEWRKRFTMDSGDKGEEKTLTEEA